MIECEILVFRVVEDKVGYGCFYAPSTLMRFHSFWRDTTFTLAF